MGALQNLTSTADLSGVETEHVAYDLNGRFHAASKLSHDLLKMNKWKSSVTPAASHVTCTVFEQLSLSSLLRNK